MAVTANSMILPQLVKRGAAACTAAKTTYADAVNAVLLYAAGANGSVLRSLAAIARATVTATQLQLFAYDGTNYWLLPNSPLMPATTVSQSTANTSVVDFGFSDLKTLYLPTGWSLYVGIGMALSGGIVFSAEMGDF